MPQLEPLFLVFAAAVVALYWLLPRERRPWLLAVANSVFLAFFDWASFIFVALTTVATYQASQGGDSGRKRGAREHSATIAIAVLCGLFIYVRGSQVYPAFALAQFVAPVGFGFYMLRLMHYRVEHARGAFRAHSLLSFYNYVLFFPTVLIGPIHRFDTFVREEVRQRWDPVQGSEGLERVLYGYVKVVVLANWLVFNRQLFLELGDATAAVQVLGECLRYGLFLYFMFAGLSDIAIGLGLLLGFRIEENFNRPFLQPNVVEFWRSWHMSLSDWCRNYIFLPVMARTRSLVLSIFASMLILGLWHEFTPRYVLWGVYHACGIAVFRWYEKTLAPRLPETESTLIRGLGTGLSTTLTFAFVIIGFTVTKNASTAEMLEDVRALIGGWSR